MRIDNGGRGFKHGSGPLNTRNDTKSFEAEIIKPFVCFVCFVGTRGQKTAERMMWPANHADTREKKTFALIRVICGLVRLC